MPNISSYQENISNNIQILSNNIKNNNISEQIGSYNQPSLKDIQIDI